MALAAGVDAPGCAPLLLHANHDETSREEEHFPRQAVPSQSRDANALVETQRGLIQIPERSFHAAIATLSCCSAVRLVQRNGVRRVGEFAVKFSDRALGSAVKLRVSLEGRTDPALVKRRNHGNADSQFFLALVSCLQVRFGLANLPRIYSVTAETRNQWMVEVDHMNLEQWLDCSSRVVLLDSAIEKNCAIEQPVGQYVWRFTAGIIVDANAAVKIIADVGLPLRMVRCAVPIVEVGIESGAVPRQCASEVHAVTGSSVDALLPLQAITGSDDYANVHHHDSSNPASPSRRHDPYSPQLRARVLPSPGEGLQWPPQILQ